MANKPGSSGYTRGDTGGSHGDYEHGVSAAWVERRATSGVKKAPFERTSKFYGKMKSGIKRSGNKFKMLDKYTAGVRGIKKGSGG